MPDYSKSLIRWRLLADYYPINVLLMYCGDTKQNLKKLLFCISFFLKALWNPK